MRISYVTETWPPEVNGVALTAARTVEYLRGRGHAVHLVRPSQGRQDCHGKSDVLMPGMPIPMYRDLRIGLPMRGALRQLWRRRPPDLVHVATEGPLGWAAVSAARGLQLPVTSDFRTRFDQYGQYYSAGVAVRLVSGLIVSYLRHFHNRTLCTFVPTVETLLQLEAHGFRNLVIIGRGVDCELFHPGRRDARLRRRWNANGPVLLYVGRLAREKNLTLLVSTFLAVREVLPGTRLIVVGDGPMRTQLERSCPGAIFVGAQTGGVLAACYASADIFLFPSLTETFGNVTLEALASGTAVVAYAAGAAAVHVRDRVNGLLVPPGDERAFIAGALMLARDEPQRLRIGVAARRTALQLRWDNILEDFETTLLDAQAIGVFDDGTCLA